MVFTWHFIHVRGGQFAPPPAFPFSLLTEGHTGVALFMVLSGYLFAKLLDGKNILYGSFIWNRFLRLAPLLFAVIACAGVNIYLDGGDIPGYLKEVAVGIIKPTFPNGGWSITAEFHFYVLLPFLLFLKNKWRYSLVVALLAVLALRLLLYLQMGQIQTLAYWTIIGRIDQFLLGIMAYQFREKISGRHIFAAFSLLLFAGFYWFFDSGGGFFMSPSYPSPSPIWIYMPTVEGLAYGLAISWYDNSFVHSTGRISRFVSLIGSYSYSIYSLHFFFVFALARAIDRYVIDLSNIHLALLFSVFGFLLMVPLGYLSFTFIESPFLKFRTPYTVPDKDHRVSAAPAAASQ